MAAAFPCRTFWEFDLEPSCSRSRALSDSALLEWHVAYELVTDEKDCESVVASTDVDDAATSWASEMDSIDDSLDFASEADTMASPPGMWFMAPTPRPVNTTLVIKNLPSDMTRARFLTLLDEHFAGAYDFMYTPINFKTLKSQCYAFLNFPDPMQAEVAHDFFDGLALTGADGEQRISASWSEQQGLQEQIERFRNCPVMHPEVPDEYKPLLLEDRRPVPFPAPTKNISAPRGFRRAAAVGAV